MFRCQNCSDLGAYHGLDNIKVCVLEIQDIRSSARNGCGICRLLLDAISSFDQDVRASDKTKIWCKPSNMRGYMGRKTHFRIDLEEEINSSSYSIELFTTLGSETESQCPPFLVPGCEILGTSSDTSMAKLKNWVQECSLHGGCTTGTTSQLPTRVIDVGEADLDAPIKLYVSRGEIDPYICLSHCWGDIQPFKTLLSTVESYKKAIELKALPNTFQHAISITRALGIKYLWIDAICIIQDSEEDWAAEASKMASIYRNSYLTIAATWSSSSLGGCFNNHDASNYISKPLQYISPEGSKYSVRTRKAPLHGFRNGVLYTRGWCFQEWLLSPRIVHFNDAEMIWECSKETYCECGQTWWSPITYIKQQASTIANNKVTTYSAERIKWWHALIEQYSQLDLTFSKDKFPAFAGVAQWIQAGSSARYVAGLWKDSLFDDLVWSRRSKASLRKRSVSWRAPTWSWASIESPVTWGWPAFNNPGKYEIFKIPLEPHPALRFVKVTAQPKGPTEFGEILTALLEVHGHLQKVSISAVAGKNVVRVDRHNLEFSLDYDLCNDNDFDAVNERLWCLPIGRQYSTSSLQDWPVQGYDVALVLLRSSIEEDVFERIGLIRHCVGDGGLVEWTANVEPGGRVIKIA